MNLPYYDDRMCRFICGIPEGYLADRKIQIEYIKNRNPKLAGIEWQDHMPFNLYDYKEPQFAKRMSYRVKHKMQREINAALGKKYIQRNWELQFLGELNASRLENHLFDADFKAFLETDVATDMYDKFKNKEAVFYSHAVSMLLTLSVWYGREKESTFFQ
jgi:hypothetical protein